MKLSPDPEVEKFGADFADFLDAHLPAEAEPHLQPHESVPAAHFGAIFLFVPYCAFPELCDN